MRFFYLVCDLLFVLILKNKTCVRSNEVNNKRALVVPFVFAQDSIKQNKVAARENKEIGKMLIESEDFCIFVEILIKAEEIFTNAKKECKKEISLNEDLIKLSKSLIKKSTWASLSQNHLSFHSYLYECNIMITDFKKLFIKKKDYYTEIDSNIIFKVVSELKEAEKRLHKAIKYFENNEINLNPSYSQFVKVDLVCHSNQIKKIIKDYKKYRALVINNLSLEKATASLSHVFEEKLDKIGQDVSTAEKSCFKKEDGFYERVFICFEEAFECLEEENKLLDLLLKDFDDIWTSKTKIIDVLTFLNHDETSQFCTN